MNTEVKRASHTQKVPHIGLPRNPPVTKVNNVKKAPISIPHPEEPRISGWFVIRNKNVVIAVAI